MSRGGDLLKKALGIASAPDKNTVGTPPPLTPEEKAATPMRSNAQSLKAAWNLAKPYFGSSDQKWKARGALATVIGLTLGQVYLDVKFSYWGNDFYKTLQEHSSTKAQAKTPEEKAKVKELEDKTYKLLQQFFLLAGIFVAVAVTKQKRTQMLQLNWQKWMKEQYQAQWLNGQNKPYYKMQINGQSVDNPDQRISDDVTRFTSRTLGLGLGFLRASTSLPSFSMILYDLAGPVWLAGAAGYAVATTAISHGIGKSLVKLNFDQQKYDANYRFQGVNIRRNAEAIALMGGETVETENLQQRLNTSVENQKKIIEKNKQLTMFTASADQAATVVPYYVMLPTLFSGATTLGDFFQAASAFNNVRSDMSWFANAYSDLAEWKGDTNRLTFFTEELRKLNGQDPTTGQDLKPQVA